MPPFLYEDYIPPEVWNSISESAKERYIETNDESVLTCPKCGISKKGLRKIEGFCVATEYSSPYYQEGVDCPYSKMFSPIHWISPENEYSEGFEEAVTDRLMVQMEVMGAESPITLHSPTPEVKNTFETGKIIPVTLLFEKAGKVGIEIVVDQNRKEKKNSHSHTH